MNEKRMGNKEGKYYVSALMRKDYSHLKQPISVIILA